MHKIPFTFLEYFIENIGNIPLKYYRNILLGIFYSYSSIIKMSVF